MDPSGSKKKNFSGARVRQVKCDFNLVSNDFFKISIQRELEKKAFFILLANRGMKISNVKSYMLRTLMKMLNVYFLNLYCMLIYNFTIIMLIFFYRSVTQPVCIHDLLWCLISSLEKSIHTTSNNKKVVSFKEEKDGVETAGIVSIVSIVSSYFIQTISPWLCKKGDYRVVWIFIIIIHWAILLFKRGDVRMCLFWNLLRNSVPIKS